MEIIFYKEAGEGYYYATLNARVFLMVAFVVPPLTLFNEYTRIHTFLMSTPDFKMEGEKDHVRFVCAYMSRVYVRDAINVGHFFYFDLLIFYIYLKG